MQIRDIVVIGGSAGALEALRELVAGFPRDFPGAVFVVVHIGSRPSALPRLLSGAGPLPASHAADGEPVVSGRIYVAPPDHHLLLAPGRVRLSRGPTENRTRPAIDPLFRSAAEAYGPRVAGVLLSGALSDGAAGLSAIKAAGGLAVVQDPGEALYPDMPLSALRHVAVDHRARASAIPPLLLREAGGKDPGPRALPVPPGAEEEIGMTGDYHLDKPVALTCPACGGSVQEETVDSLTVYKCHIGHRYAAADMDEAQFQQMEQAISVALRTLNERVELCRRMVRQSAAQKMEHAGSLWRQALAEAEERAEVLRRFVGQDWVRPDADRAAE